MNFKNKLLIICSIMMTVLSSVNATPTAQRVESDTAIQNAVLVHINEYRRQHRLSELKMDNNIIREARQHSMDMASHKMPFGHQGFTKRIARLHTQIKNSSAGAENVAYNYKDANTVVKQWVLSPGHKRNIVGNYNLTGIGIARDKQGKIYYTQIFLHKNLGKPVVKVGRHRSMGISFGSMSLFKRNA